MFETEQIAEESARGVVKVEQDDQPEVLPVHSQVRRIKREHEAARELLLRLQLLEMRPATGGFRREPTSRRASPSPLRRAGGGQAISVGD
ncbi:hypothetical protein HU200_005248 [Digitaria exilis]|uniref:Uncharacterized protein n=1 Tax=Digitaria exilis TaxID=1010633 RepID=A0A835FTC5_9POAL|nr:hypothetical protein HU200_005248 [Digitaria exilis]